MDLHSDTFQPGDQFLHDLFAEALELSEQSGSMPLPDWLGNDFPYVPDEFIGRGGSGFVWKAHSLADQKSVALKIIVFRGDLDLARERWMREVQVASKVAHEHLIQLYESGVAPDGSAGWLALEWISGSCLRNQLLKTGPLPWSEVSRLAQQACSGLLALHRAALVHRDIKPANILYDEHSERFVIADFGVALPLKEERVTRTHEAVLTPGYSAPEQSQIGSTVDGRADQFALASTLWELLTGTLPVGAFGKLDSTAPRWVEPVLRKALSPKSSDRFPDIECFARALSGHHRWRFYFKPIALTLLLISLIGLFFILRPPLDSQENQTPPSQHSSIIDTITSHVIEGVHYHKDYRWTSLASSGTWSYQLIQPGIGKLTLHHDSTNDHSIKYREEIVFPIDLSSSPRAPGKKEFFEDNVLIESHAYSFDFQTESYAPDIHAFTWLVRGRTLGGYHFLSHERFILEKEEPGKWTVERLGPHQLKVIFTYDEDENLAAHFREEVVLTFDGSSIAQTIATEYESEEVTEIINGSVDFQKNPEK